MIDKQIFKKTMDLKLKVKHDDTERVKIINNKKLLGNKANGWWGFKINYNNDMLSDNINNDNDSDSELDVS